MDRQEAIQTLSKVGKISVLYAEDLYDSFFEKPVVPQCVADWYERNKVGLEFYLIDWIISSVRCTDKKLTEFDKWLTDTDNNPIQTLVNMRQFGYEVEKEARYTVKIKGISGYSKYLNLDTKYQQWLFASETELERFRAHHTRKELEANDFGWVFDCPGVEVKEVE